MNIRLHVSYTQSATQIHANRAWILPDSIRQKCVLIL